MLNGAFATIVAVSLEKSSRSTVDTALGSFPPAIYPYDKLLTDPKISKGGEMDDSEDTETPSEPADEPADEPAEEEPEA